MNRQRGNILSLFSVSLGFLSLVALFVVNYCQLFSSHKQAQNSIDAAALQAAKDIGRIVVVGKCGPIALLDDSAADGSIDKRPVTGINSLMARIRLDAIIAEKLDDPIMESLAQQELADALDDRTLLIKALTTAGTGTAHDKEGKIIDVRGNAERVYNANRAHDGFGELDGQLTISVGVMKQPKTATNIPVPTPNNLSQTNGSNTETVNGKLVYKANVAIGTANLSETVTFAPLANEVALIENGNFDAATADTIPYAVKVSGAHKVKAMASDNQESIAMESSAQAGGPRITLPSGALTITLPGAALVGNGGVKFDNPMSIATSNGKWRQGVAAQWSPSAHGRSDDDGSEALSVMAYDWIRSLGLRPDIESLDGTLKRHFNTVSVAGRQHHYARPKSRHENTIELAECRTLVAIDAKGFEHNLTPSHYKQVQMSGIPSAGPGSGGGSGSGSGTFSANLGGDFADTRQIIDYNWILVQKGSIPPVAAAPAHYGWLDPGSYGNGDPNRCPSNSATIPPMTGIQVGTAARSQANISNFYRAPVFTNVLTMPRHPMPQRYYSFKDNHFYNRSGNGYVQDPAKPTLAELCSRNGVQVDAPWVGGQQAMGQSDSVCPHIVYLRSLSESYFEVHDNCMNVAPMISPTTAYPNIFMWIKPAVGGSTGTTPPPGGGSVGVVTTPPPTSPGAITPQPYYGPPPTGGATTPTPTPNPAPPPKKNDPPSTPPPTASNPPSTPPPTATPTTSYTYVYFVKGDVTEPNDQGSGQIKVVRMLQTPFRDGVLNGQSAYSNPEANLVYAGSTVSPSLTWKVRGRNLNASNKGDYFADTHASGYSTASQDFYNVAGYNGRVPSLVGEWIIYQ